MANVGFATLQVIPSLRGLESALGKGLAPVSGLAAKEGQAAGKALGGSLTNSALSEIAPGANALLKRITSGITSPAGIAALGAAAFVGLVNVGKQFGSINRIVRQETGATGATLDGLGKTVRRVFAVAPEGLKDITSAVDELFKRGVPLGAQLDRLAEQELFLSKITGSDLAGTIESTTAIFAKFNIPVRDQSRELDVLFKAQQQSGKGFDELAGTLKTAGAVLQRFGFNLDESTALVAGLEKAGVNVQPALAGLKKAFGSITQAGGKPKEVLRGLIKELTDGKNPTDAMAHAIKLFGNRSGAELAIAIQKGKLSISDMLKVITDGRGGIIETGQATLTLAEKFTLFKHRALLDLESFGTQALKVFKQVVNEGGPVLGDLIGSITRTLQELAPALAPIGLLLVGAFKVAIPVLELVARDLDLVAGFLSHIPAPVIAAAAVLGVLAVAALGAADGLIAAGRAAVSASFEFATTPIGALAVALGVVVSAISIFGHKSDGGAKAAKDFGKALFDTESSAGAFASGISSATDGIDKYLKSQVAASDPKFATLLARSGTTVEQIGKHLGDGKDAWDAYTTAIAKSSAAASGSQDIGNLVAKGVRATRDAFIAATKAELATVVANDQLKQSDIDALVARDKNRDGTINYVKVADDLNRILADQALKQDAVASGNIKTSATYAQLANAIATGAISSEAATAALKELGFSATGAAAKQKELTSQTQSFVSAVTGALPSAAEQVKKFGQQIASDSSTLESDVKAKADIMAKIAKSGGKASNDLKQSLSDATKKIVEDLHTLAADQDPAKFTAGLQDQAKKARAFLGDLRTLVREGFGSLAGILAQQGPEAAGGLAAGLAGDKAKARVAAGAADLLTSTNDSIARFAAGHFSELNGIGAQMASAVTSRFTPNLQPGASKAIRAAAAVLQQDRTVTQAAGHRGLATVAAFESGFGPLTVGQATTIALEAARDALSTDTSVAAAAAGVGKRVTDRFHPSFTHRTNVALQAAAVALENDPTVSQAAGDLAIQAIAKYSGNLTTKQATSLAIQAARDAITRDPTLKAAFGAKGVEATGKLRANLKPGEAAQQALDTANVAVSQSTQLANRMGFAGFLVGQRFATGIAQGIDSHQIDVTSAAGRVAQAAVDKANSVFQNQSPSKVGITIGRFFSTGIAIGMADTSRVTAAGVKLTTSVGRIGRDIAAATQPIVVPPVRVPTVRGVAADVIPALAPAARTTARPTGPAPVNFTQNVTVKSDQPTLRELEFAGRHAAWRLSNTGRRPGG